MKDKMEKSSIKRKMGIVSKYDHYAFHLEKIKDSSLGHDYAVIL